jgi:hypothetical protein
VADATSLSSAEVLPDVKGPTGAGLLSRAVAWFNGQGYRYADAKCCECQPVLSDCGSAQQSDGENPLRPWD